MQKFNSFKITKRKKLRVTTKKQKQNIRKKEQTHTIIIKEKIIDKTTSIICDRNNTRDFDY